jgi:hypothetical protein
MINRYRATSWGLLKLNLNKYDVNKKLIYSDFLNIRVNEL